MSMLSHTSGSTKWNNRFQDTIPKASLFFYLLEIVIERFGGAECSLAYEPNRIKPISKPYLLKTVTRFSTSLSAGNSFTSPSIQFAWPAAVSIRETESA